MPEKLSELNPAELAMVERYLERQKKRTVPSMKVTKVAGKNMLAPDHQNEDVGKVLLMDALGTASVSFLNGLLSQLANVGCQGQDLQAADINFMLAMVEGIGPRDQTEAMLAAQMAAIHNATMTAARRLAHVDTIPQQDSASNMLNKLGRTFAAQVEALKKYRSSGEQNIKVQHVTVNEGGQAIVGNVQAGGGGHEKGEGQPLEPGGASAGCAPLLSHVETYSPSLPGPSSPRLDSVPVPRSSRWSSERQG